METKLQQKRERQLARNTSLNNANVATCLLGMCMDVSHNNFIRCQCCVYSLLLLSHKRPKKRFEVSYPPDENHISHQPHCFLIPHV